MAYPPAPVRPSVARPPAERPTVARPPTEPPPAEPPVSGPDAPVPLMSRAEALAAARSAVRRSRERRHQQSGDTRAPGGPPVPGPVPPPQREPPGCEPLSEPGPGDGSEPGRVGGGFFTEREERQELPEPDGRYEESRRLPLKERWRLALEERLPVWLRVRCGMELKTLVALCLVLLVAVGFAVHHFWTGRPQGVAVPSAPGSPSAPASQKDGTPAAPAAGGSAPTADGAQGKRLVVDVSGKVRDPGVLRLPAGSRVADALKAAGGLRKGADTSGLNRARLLVDGEQIVVGAPGRAGAAPGGAPGPSGASGASGAPISLNSATQEQLETLPGVGPVLAQHIVDYRTQHGGFRSVDQLQEVNGIGEKRFADIKPQVVP
ncbi:MULTISPECIES: ComEA family DNA-binding protein [Streptomyces]|uniref:ComEA family DNA-binding protein n=1 Tax=Streptomyces TaxID=1883 RepID=UPI001FFDDD38|nr:ComEA family DNA-binding protein [Streptomyces sp. RK75]